MRLVKFYQVDLLIYCFHESLPDSRPPPVSFSPPKAPPISAPLVGMFRFTIPQSDPFGPILSNILLYITFYAMNFFYLIYHLNRLPKF